MTFAQRRAVTWAPWVWLIAECCLNHSLGGLVAVYDKHDYLTERRKTLELWSANIAALEKGEAFNVVPFKRAANE
jgi:hypothetical protein